MLTTLIPSPFLPSAQYVFSKYLVFDMNTPTLVAAVYLSYYTLLEPVSAVGSQMILPDQSTDQPF